MLPIAFGAINNENDKSKIEQIWHEYENIMFRVAYKILNNQHSAEDAVSEACIKIIRNLQKIQNISSNETKALIVIIVRSVSIDIIRKSNSRLEDYKEVSEIIPDKSLDIQENIIAKESYETIMKTIKALPEHQKDVVYLSFIYEYSHKEISEILGISENASRKRLYDAKKEIIKRLGGEDYGK